MKLYARRGFEWAEDGLVGLWSPVLTGATQGMLLDCNPSTNNHGSLNGYSNLNTAWFGSQHGTVNDYDGVNNRILTSAWRGMSGDYSISFWFQTTFSSGTVTCMLGSSYSGAGGVHLMGVRPTDGAIYAFAGGERWWGSGYNNNTWVFATVVRRISDGLGTMFANGISLGSQQGFGTLDPATGNNFGFGRTGFGVFFQGQIAEIIFHGRMLSLAEHQQAFRAGPGGAWQDRPRRSRFYFGSTGNRRRRILCGDYN